MVTATAVRPDRTLLRPSGLLVSLVLVVMFIPMRRYTLPSTLPFHLEPYRLVIVLLIVGTVLSVLVDPRWALRRLGFGGIIAALVATAVLSIAVNVERIVEEGLAGAVTAKLFLLLSFISVFVIVRLLVTTAAQAHVLLRALVASAAVLGLAAIVESRTKQNLFDQFFEAVPILERTREATVQVRGSNLRAVASAQHSIALGSLFSSLLPLAVYLLWRDGGERSRRRWLWAGSAGLMVMGTVATLSRTAMLTLAAAAVVGLVLRPGVVVSFASFSVPVLLCLALVLPGPARALYRSFFPATGLVAQQQGFEGSSRSTGRLADLAPTVEEVSLRPFLGQGYGTRIVDGPLTNATLVDNEYLSRAAETGLVGLVPLGLLILVPIRRMWQRARADASSSADLAAALACSFSAYGLSLFLYGAWAFAQEVLVFFMLLAVAGWLLVEGPRPEVEGRASGG